MKHICKVCQEEYTNPHTHIYVDGKVRDEAHRAYLDKIQHNAYEPECFCGSGIAWLGNNLGYEVRCLNCDLLYEED